MIQNTQLEILSVIGSGASGIVHRGVWQVGRLLAACLSIPVREVCVEFVELPTLVHPRVCTGHVSGREDHHLLQPLPRVGQVQEPARAHGSCSVQVHHSPQRRHNAYLRPAVSRGALAA